MGSEPARHVMLFGQHQFHLSYAESVRRRKPFLLALHLERS